MPPGVAICAEDFDAILVGQDAPACVSPVMVAANREWVFRSRALEWAANAAAREEREIWGDDVSALWL